MKPKTTLRTTMMRMQYSSGSNLTATRPTQAWPHWLLPLLVCALALLWTTPAAHAQSTVIVTNANDAGAGSLRQALTDTAAGGAIVFDNTLSGATIRLASQLTLSKNVTIDGSTLATPITISGDTNNDGTGDVRAFLVNSGVTATLKNVTLTKGNALGYTPPYGGAIYNEGDLTIINSSLTASRGDYAGAIGNWGTLRVRGSTFASNQANHQGGAIMNFGTLDIANSTIAGNSAGSYGGGISNVETGATTLTNVTIWQNAADVSGFADSTATSGGGIYVSGTATKNPSVLAYANTIIAGSTKGNDCEIRLARSTLSINQFNFVGDGTGQCSATNSGNPLLGALANNGGPTQTAAPSIGSPVIDAGSNAYCASTQVDNVDQRGVTRPWGTHCDIGAVEYAQATPPTAPVAGRNGTLSFDGTNAYVSLSSDADKVSAASLGLPVKDITVEAWVNIAQFKKWSAFISFLQDNGASEWGWALGTWGTPEPDGVYFGLSTTGTGATYLSDYSVLANRWVHLAGTYDGATMKLYVDGDLMNSSTAQSGNIAYADSWYRLGSYKDDDEEFRIQGAMDEVRVWNVARSQADIQADMYRRLTGSEAGLVNYWPMDEGSGTVTNDRKGTINGALVGLPAWMKTGPAIRPGLDLSFATNDDTPLNDALIGMDPDGGALTFAALTQPTHGALQITNAQTGAFTYTPTPNTNGTDSFTYRVTDSQSLTDDATVTIAVRSVNSPPVAGRNGALSFDGANDIVDLGNVAALNGVNRYTLEGWVRFAAFNNYATVLAKRQSDGDRAAMIQLYGASGQVAVAVNGGYGYSSSTVELNKWVHLAAVYDGTQATNADRLKLYIDGVPTALTFLSSVPATTPTSATRLTLGAEYPRQQCQPPTGAACGANRRSAPLEWRTQPVRNPDGNVQSHGRRRSRSRRLLVAG